jgi:hypothetical protein
VNGDGTVDGSDLSVTDNNASNFVSKVTPFTSPTDIAVAKSKIKTANEQYRKSRKSDSDKTDVKPSK